jgi:aminopeptidase N
MSGKIMKYLKILIISLYPFLLMAQSSESGSFENFLKLEQEGWLEKIEAERYISPDTTIDVKFYHISLKVSLNPFIKGNVNCIFTSNISSLTEIKLDLTSSLTVDSIGGSGVSYSHTSDKLVIQLNRPYTSGEETSVIIYYSGAPPVIYNTKGIRYEKHHGNQPVIATLSTPFLAHLWFPCKDGPEDKADSVYIDITIPDTSFNNIKLSATSNGELENVVSQNGKRTFYWRERYPIVPFYVMIAVSNYVTFVQDYSDTSGSSFPIIYNVFKEDSAVSVQGVQQLPEAMRLFSRLFGRYPFSSEKYGMTQIGFYGAIENQTNTIQNSLDIGSFDVSVHELAHMWFGDMITCSSWHHGWLNEGFATYCSALWAEHSSGQQAYRNYMKNREYFYGGTIYLQITDDPFYIFIPIIYSKGAWVLHMLRGVLGDEAFFSSLLAVCFR